MDENQGCRFAAVYVRVSTEDQAELSPDSQLEEIRKYAQREGIVILKDHIYIDPGLSGRSAERRPQFQNMIAAAKQKDCPFTVLLLWKFSRFARNQQESMFYKDILRTKCGVAVISVSEPIDEGPFGSLIERIIEWMDEFYSIRLSQEVKRSMTVNAERGVFQSRPPYGYRLTDRRLTVCEEEAEIVRFVFRSFNAGMRTRQIALSAAAMDTAGRSAWNVRRVKRILRNPTYCGCVHWNSAGRTGDQFYPEHPESNIVRRGAHEAIVSDELFDSCQKRLREIHDREAAADSSRKPLKHWLAGGNLRCALCSYSMIAKRSHGSLYFVCGGYSVGACTCSSYINAAKAEQAIMDRLREDLNSDSIEYRITYSSDDQAAAAAAASRSVQNIETRLRRLQDAYLAGVIELDDFASAKAALSGQLDEARRRLALLQEQADAAEAVARIHDSIRRALDVLCSDESDIESRHRAFRAITESCTWNKPESVITITYRLPLD